MRTWQTIDVIRQRTFERWRGKQIFIQTPEEAGVLAFTGQKGCLTHLCRYVTHYHFEWGTMTAWVGVCSVGSSPRKGYNVDPAKELFGCHRCIMLAEKHGLPTFSLVPSTGCEATGGQKYRPRHLVQSRPWHESLAQSTDALDPQSPEDGATPTTYAGASTATPSMETQSAPREANQ